MNLKYLAPSATAALPFVVAMLFVLLISCSSDDGASPVPVASPTVLPQETAVPVPTMTAAIATSTPEPTATPEPTSTPMPTPTPTSTPIAFPPLKEFPQALRFDSEPLEEAEVIALWTDFLTDTRTLGQVVTTQGVPHGAPKGADISVLGEIWLCSDRTGRAENVQPYNSQGRAPGSFTWEVMATDDWNRVAVRLKATGEFDTSLWFQWYGYDENGLFSREFTTVGIEDISAEHCL